MSRYVFLFYLLSRLQAQDVLQSSALLACLPNIRVPASSGSSSSSGAVGESLWSVESSQGDQQLLNGILQTTASLIIGIKVCNARLSRVRVPASSLASPLLTTPLSCVCCFLCSQHVLKTDSAFRTAVFPSCFLLLARASCFSHKQCLRLLLACADCLTVEESASFLAQLQREGRRADAASPDAAAAAAVAAATSASSEAPAVLAPTPLSQLSSQIASVTSATQPASATPSVSAAHFSFAVLCSSLSSSLYQQFQASHPQLFKAAAARKS